MIAHDITSLVDFIAAPDGSVSIAPKTYGNEWDILEAAERTGWTDPGFTEPFEVTVERARAHLRSL